MIGLNHLGIQVESATELDAIHGRLEALQPALEKEEGAACCYAKSDKYWVNDPSGIAWETFHTLDSNPVFGKPYKTEGGTDACCIPLAKLNAKADSPCCVPTAKKTESGACC